LLGLVLEPLELAAADLARSSTATGKGSSPSADGAGDKKLPSLLLLDPKKGAGSTEESPLLGPSAHENVGHALSIFGYYG